MKNELNAISLRRKMKVSVDGYTAPIRKGMIAAILANTAKLGFTLSPALIEKLEATNEQTITDFYKFLIPELKKMVGADVVYRPMYPNFPKQVAEASDEELWFNAIMHYFGDAIGVRIMPVYEKEERFPLCDFSKMKVIGLATEGEVNNIFSEIVSSKTSPSLQDREDIVTFLNLAQLSKVEVNNKETLAFVTYESFKVAKGTNPNAWLGHGFIDQIKTSTDVLRLAVAMSEGDISLAEKTKFKNFSRRERRGLLNQINILKLEQASEDMMRHRTAWIRLGEKLHPREFQKRFPNAAEAFRRIRNEGAETFNSKVDKFVRQDKWEDVVNLLSTRPGEFARKLYYLIKNTKGDKTNILQKYEEIAPSISNSVLWQVYGHFVNHDMQVQYRNRLFIPKGKVANIISADNNLVNMNGYDRMIAIITWNTLVNKYKELPSLGKVYIDPLVDKILIPQGNRTASSSLRTVGKGSRFALDKNANILRLFVYWKDLKEGWNSRVDLDLSAIQYNANWDCLGQCSYTSLRNLSNKQLNDYDMLHSGDETSAPNGASEFIDINLNKIDKNIAYIAVTVTSYTGQKFSELDEGFAGWMVRKSMGNEGEIYEPTTVEGRLDLRSESTVTAPIILDVRNKEIIWCDIALKNSGYGYNVHSTANKSAQAADAVSRMFYTKPTLGDLFFAHADARSTEIVLNREDADFVIGEEGDVSPFDIAKIMSEFV